MALFDKSIYNEIRDHSPSPYIVLEGPDGVGKSTLTKDLQNWYSEDGFTVKLLRFPDNLPNLPLRDIILSPIVSSVKTSQFPLFIANFIMQFHLNIKPYLDDSKTVFIIDRFIPSTLVYQGLSLEIVENALSHDEEFVIWAKNIHYVFMSPKDIHSHLNRIANRNSEDKNHFDPSTLDDIIENISRYEIVSEACGQQGILDSKNVTTIMV